MFRLRRDIKHEKPCLTTFYKHYEVRKNIQLRVEFTTTCIVISSQCLKYDETRSFVFEESLGLLFVSLLVLLKLQALFSEARKSLFFCFKARGTLKNIINRKIIVRLTLPMNVSLLYELSSAFATQRFCSFWKTISPWILHRKWKRSPCSNFH